MASFRTWVGPAAQQLGRHVDRFCQTLEDLAYRLRETLSALLGQTAEELVREAVKLVLRPRLPGPWQPPWPPRPSWNVPPEEEEEQYDEYGNLVHEEDDVDLDQRGPLPVADSTPARSRRWRHAVAVGLHMAGWWLRRQMDRVSTAAAVAVGVTTASAAYVAGAGVAGLVLRLAALVETACVSSVAWTRRF